MLGRWTATRPRRLALSSMLSVAVVGLAFVPGLGLLLLPGFVVSMFFGESHSVAFVRIGIAFSWFLYAFVAFSILEIGNAAGRNEAGERTKD